MMLPRLQFRDASRRQRKEETQVFLVGDYFAPGKSSAALQRLPDLKADSASFLRNALDELDAIAGSDARPKRIFCENYYLGIEWRLTAYPGGCTYEIAVGHGRAKSIRRTRERGGSPLSTSRIPSNWGTQFGNRRWP